MPQTFQIISSGVDGLYGLGGQYRAADAVLDRAPAVRRASHATPNDGTVRQREYDNLTNFKSGTLQ